MKGRAGQAMIFLIMVLVILTLVVLWNFDLHKIVYVKFVSQNAGDAAALAAARWQGLTLNLIGDLNIMQAVALTAGETNTSAAIADLQARLCYVGPMVGLVAAQQAAKNNGVFNNPAFTSNVLKHADTVLHDYTRPAPDGTMLFPEPYTNCWQEYADMLYAIADDGIAAGPDNARFYDDYAGGHLLLLQDFYDAVAGSDWCWFHINAPDLLNTYTDYQWWPPLPERIPHSQPMNSEYFGLGLTKLTMACGTQNVQLMARLNQDLHLGGDIASETGGSTSVWYCYSSRVWTEWSAFSYTGTVHFPAAGPIKPQYDYAGADVAVRIEAHASRLTPGAGSNTIVWSAAAKPFGYLGDGDLRPDTYRLVLPAFHDIRLIPVDTASGPSGGAFNLAWREHIEEHLPPYLRDGLAEANKFAAGGCPYCAALIVWEDHGFRQSGIDWLAEHSQECETAGGGGGGGGGGGSRIGH
jgi:hypothetical protein